MPDTPRASALIRAYFASLPPDGRRAIKQLRTAIKAAAPDAAAAFSYRIPGFTLNGRILVWYAAWQNHVSIYPATTAMRRAGGRALARYEMSQGTIRFPLAEPVPVAMVRRLVRARAAEITQDP